MIEVISVGDTFCAMKFEEKEVVVKTQDVVTALQAAVKNG